MRRTWFCHVAVHLFCLIFLKEYRIATLDQSSPTGFVETPSLRSFAVADKAAKNRLCVKLDTSLFRHVHKCLTAEDTHVADVRNRARPRLFRCTTTQCA